MRTIPRIVGAVLAVLVGAIRCTDPPGDVGSLAIDFQVTATRPPFAALDLMVEQVAVFYKPSPDAGLKRDGGDDDNEESDCGFSGAEVIKLPTAVHLDLTQVGRTLIAGIAVSSGEIADIRLAVVGVSVTSGTDRVSPHIRTGCTLVGADGGAEHVEILRLTPQSQLIVSKETNVEVAVLFDPNAAFATSDEGDDQGKEDHGDGGDDGKAPDGGHDDGPGSDSGGGNDDHGGRDSDSGDTQHGDGGDDDADAGHHHSNDEDAGHGHETHDGGVGDEQLSLKASYQLLILGNVGSFIPNQLIVRFKNGTPQATIDAAIAQFQGTVISVWAPTNLYTLSFPIGTDLAAATLSLDQSGIVGYTLPNMRLTMTGSGCPFDGTCPNDFDATLQPELLQVKAPQAWRRMSIPGGRGEAIVAVIDTGFALDHPDLIGNIYINSRPGECTEPRHHEGR